MPLDKKSPIVTSPQPETGGQIWFPIVNRIMIQIKNLDDNSYQTWGENTSSISYGINDLSSGRVICEKANIIPPASTSATSNNYFGATYDYENASPRDDDDRVYKLQDFANSIILYKDKSIPDNLEGTDTTKSDLVSKRVYSAKQNTDLENEKYTLPDSENGFEIKIWLENEYDNGSMQTNDFNIVTLTNMNRIMDENGTEITSSSFIGQPIRFLTVDSPTKIRVADYGATDGFHVKLKRINNTTIHYLECIIPRDAVNPTDITKKNEDGKKVESTQSSGQENEVYFKGYFIEFQTIEADTNANKTLTELADVFNVSGTNWEFINFETFSSNGISFNKSQPNDTHDSSNMATDDQAELGTVVYPDGATNAGGYGFISAAPYSGGFSTKTEDIDWNVSKAFTLNQGDNKFYRFRIRGLNSGNKNVGPVSEKYFYFRFNEPDQINWNTSIPPTFNAGQLNWDISLNWNITNSSKPDTDNNSYTTTDLSIMEYKLQRRDSDSESWQTISYWKNTNTNAQLTNHNYRIWPTPAQTIDSNYNSKSQTVSWSTYDDSNKAEWVYYEETTGGTKIYTQEARLLATDQSTLKTYKTRNPTFEFRIQARNYLFGKRVDTANFDAIVITTKQWFIEGNTDSTNDDKNITDTRWSVHSGKSSGNSTGLATTAHTSTYTPLLQDDVDNEEDKYEIKFYEKDSADSKSPWKDQNGNTDYDTNNTRRVKYTNDSTASRTINNNEPYNNTPENDYISYQWKITDESNKTTVDSTTGLSIDRYEIIETYSIGASSDNSAITNLTPTTIIYSPDFRRGPANWHIRKYDQFISSSPSFKFKVRAFNFFNSTSSNYSLDSTLLEPTKPSEPRYLSSPAGTPPTKKNSNPTFALTDNGITILVDEPEFTGQPKVNRSQYQDQSISIKEFALQDIRLDSEDSAPAGEITLINGHSTTSRSNNDIQGNQSQVATFYHPNGYTNNPNTALKDLNNGKVDYTFHAKNVLKDEFSSTSSCTLTIGKPYPGENFKYCPKFTWVPNTNKVKLDFFRKDSSIDILYDDDNPDTSNDSTVAPLSNVTNNCNFSNTIKNLAWEVQCLASSNWTPTGTIPNEFATNTNFTTTGDNNTISAYSISDIHIEDQPYETTYTIDYRIRNQYNQNYFASNVSNDIGNDTSPLQIKLDVPVWTTDDNNVFTSKFTYGLPTANSINDGNKIDIYWNRPAYGGLYFKHQGATSISQVPSPNIKTYKIYLKATNHISTSSTDTYYICTITQNWETGDYKNALHDSIPTLTIYSGGATSPASATGNDKQTIVIKKITGGTPADYYSGTENSISNFRFKPEHEYTVEKITAINWLYDEESENMNSGIKTLYQNGIDGGTTATITSLTPVKINALEKVNYPPIGSNNYIATTASTATDPTVSAAGAANAVAGPQLNTFSQYANNGSLINGAGISSTTDKKINKLAEILGTSVSNIIINKDYAKIPNNTVGMSIRLGVKIGSGNETFTNFCTFTNSACSNKDLKYTWGTGPTETTIATISSGTSTTTDVNPADIYTGTNEWKTDNQTYWFKSESIKISTASTINDVTAFYGESVVFKVYVYYHSSNKAYNETLSNTNDSETYSDVANWTLTNTTAAAGGSAAGDYYDDGSLEVPTAIEETTTTTAGTITYTGDKVYTVLGLPILKSGQMPSIQYKFDNKSTKWALDTNNKVLDVKLGTEDSSVISTISTTNTINSDHNWSDTTSVSLTSNLDIIFPNTENETSLVKDAQLFVKATNIVGKQLNWYSGWTGIKKFIYDPKTLSLITIINNQNLETTTIESGTIFNSSSVSLNNKPLFYVLKTPNNFNPLTDHGTGNNWYGNTNKFSILDVESSDVNISGTNNNISQIPIYDEKFVSETYFRNKFGTNATDYQSNVNTFISNMYGTINTTVSVYADANNNIQDILKTNYRWGIFSMSYKNTSVSAKAVNYAEFSLGPNTMCNFVSSDLYSFGAKSVANVEIWYKCINDIVETRWNKLCEADSADKANATNDINQNYKTGLTAASLPSSGWILNASDTTASSAITNENNWASIKRIQFLIKQEVAVDNKLDILIAIGIKNNIDRFFSIPRGYSSNYIFRSSSGLSAPYNSNTIG